MSWNRRNQQPSGKLTIDVNRLPRNFYHYLEDAVSIWDVNKTQLIKIFAEEGIALNNILEIHGKRGNALNSRLDGPDYTPNYTSGYTVYSAGFCSGLDEGEKRVAVVISGENFSIQMKPGKYEQESVGGEYQLVGVDGLSFLGNTYGPLAKRDELDSKLEKVITKFYQK